MKDKKKKYPTQPSFVGDKIYLRTVTEDDVINAHYWRVQSEPQRMSCHPVNFMSTAEVAESYRKRTASPTEYIKKFAIVRCDDKVTVGVITFFGYNSQNRSVELGLTVDPDEQRKGYGREAMRLLIKYLFEYCGMNKVYAQTAGFNEAAIKLMESMGFKRDATLRDHYFLKGEFHNGFIYSLLQFELDW